MLHSVGVNGKCRFVMKFGFESDSIPVEGCIICSNLAPTVVARDG